MGTTSPPRFGALLRRYRLSAGLTQEALAERAGVSARGVQDLERGVHTSPRPDTVQLLAEALGLDGAARAELIVAARPALATPQAPIAPPLRLPALPAPPTTLVGREREVAAACALLHLPGSAEGTRLLTLTGPGGVGKTRLALAIAGEVAADFADGVAWIELAPVDDPALVAAAVGSALGVQEDGQRPLPEVLAAVLADRRLLLVLDNFEHVLPAAPLVSELLAAAPHLTVLATSRARLRLRGEREFPVAPLPVPAVAAASPPPLAGLAGVAAVRLFVERAAEVRPEFVLTQDNAAAVAAICQRVEGLPLALELAAARVMLLPPQALLERLEQRLPLLTGGARDLPHRQQTMRDAIAWSHDLLSPEEQTLFRRLAVFAGGCTLEAAEQVGSAAAPPTASVLDLVASLLDQHLLQRTTGPRGEPRIYLLETIREYALDQLSASGEADAVRDAHAAYYLALAEWAEVGLQGAEQVSWLERLEVEHDNLRAALRWLPARDAVEPALRLAGALWLFRWLHGHYAEGRAEFEALLALPGAAGRTVGRLKALNGLGVIALSQGDTERAVAAHEEALAIARELADEPGIAFSLACLAAALLSRGELARAEAATTESLSLSQDRGDQWGMHIALNLLAITELHAGDHDRAEEHFREGLTIGRALGVLWGTAGVLDNLGWLALEHGDAQRARALFEESLAMMGELGDRHDRPDALAGLARAIERQGNLAGAIALLQESLALARETGDQRSIAQALFWLGHAVWQQGDREAALDLVRQALVRYDAIGHQVYVGASLEALAVLAMARDEATAAARLLGATAALLERVGAVIPPNDRFEQADIGARAADALGPEAFAAAWESGRALSPEQAVVAALSWVESLI